MVVAVVQFDLFMPHNRSLKEKRHLLTKLKERVYSQLKVTVNEVDHGDLWQRSKLGFALVGNEEKPLESLTTRTMNFIVSLGVGDVGAEDRDYIHYE
jgi:Uncharacterized protein conserved in bacteria